MNAKILFDVVTTRCGAEFGDTPLLFSLGGRDAMVADLQATQDAERASGNDTDGWDWDAFPDATTMTLAELIEWMREPTSPSAEWLLGEAAITDDEHAAIRAALEETE